MADDSGSGGTGLQDAFSDVAGAPDAVTGADPAVPAGGTAEPAAPAAPAAPAEIQMPPEWMGRGAPPRPEQVRNDIDARQHQADALRQRAQQLSDQEHRLDADVNVANQLLAVREDDYQQLHGRAGALDARIAEVEKDVHRKDPDVKVAMDRVIELKQQLGEPLPSRTDLIDPSTGEQPAPAPEVTVETDPAKVAELRTQLADAQARLDRVQASSSGSDAELQRLKAEQADLTPQVAQAKDAWDAQKTRADDLSTRAQTLEQEGTKSLDQARGLEHEVSNLTVAMPDYQQIWDKYAAEHPDQAKVGTGELEVHVSARERAEAYAQGRREEAGRLEQQATDADKAAADAANGASSRLELAQRNEEQANELTQQAQASTQRAAALQGQADDGMKRAQTTADDADRLTKEANDLRTAGRIDAADTMSQRAVAMNQQAIDLQTQSDHQSQQAKQALDASQTAQLRSTELTQEATNLRGEATTMQQSQTTLEQQATKLREDAQSRDTIAKSVEDQLQSGGAFKFQLVDDRMGESTTLDVPAGPAPYPTPDAVSGAGAPAPADNAPPADATTPADSTTSGALSDATAADPSTSGAVSDATAADPSTSGAVSDATAADPSADAASTPTAGDPATAAGDVLLEDDVTGAATAPAPAPDATAADPTAAALADTPAVDGSDATGATPDPAPTDATPAELTPDPTAGADLGTDPAAAPSDMSDFAASDPGTPDPSTDDGLDS